MYELIQAGACTYYIQSPSKVGVYRISDTEVCLIDSGNDRDAGKKILKILEAKGWTVACIINTHFHADHIGGNALIQERTGCPIYAAGIDRFFINNPFLEPTLLYGGYPCKEMRNKFLMAEPSVVQELSEAVLPVGMQMRNFNGHSFAMTALKTADEVWFLADALVSCEILAKYHLSFIYDVKSYIENLNQIEHLEGRLFIPSHASALEDIHHIVSMNREKISEVIKTIAGICAHPLCFDDIMKHVFDAYQLNIDINQYVLAGSTVRSYVSFMHDTGMLEIKCEGNKLLWHTAFV